MTRESYDVYVNNYLDADDLSLTEALDYAKNVFQKYANNGSSVDVKITLVWRAYIPKVAEWKWEEDN